MKMKMERDENIESSFDYIQLSDTFFSVADANSMIPLPNSSDVVPVKYNQGLSDFDSHGHHSCSLPRPVPDSSHHFFHFFPHPFNNSYDSSSSSSRKRPRFDSATCPNHLFSPPLQPQRELARQRRQTISDKVRCLQKLMPCEKKMDTATTLEEAYKYVRFLQAQVQALYSMPLDSTFALQNDLDGYGCESFGGGLEILNRQQILQVLINSPVAQTMLYSKGFCVLSLEQLILMNKLAQAKLFMQQQHHHQ